MTVHGSELTPTRTWAPDPGEEGRDDRAIRLDSEDIRERQHETVADTLREEPGVHVQQTNRGAGAPIIRGQVGPGVLIVHDGVRINDATFRTGPNQYLNLFDPLSLERIELLRGTAGTTWGSDAIGGIVFLAPPPLLYRRGWGASLQQRFESADRAWLGSPDLNWSGESVSLRAGGSWSRHGELRTGGGEVVPASDYRKFTARGSIGLLTGPTTELELHYAGAFIRDAGRVDRLDDANVRFIDNDQHLAWTRFTIDGSGWRERVTLLGSFKRTREDTLRHDCTLGNVHGFDPVVRTTIDRLACIRGNPGEVAGRRTQRDTAWVPGWTATVEGELGDSGLHLAWGTDGQWTVVDRSEEFRFAAEDSGWIAGERRPGSYPDGAHMGLLGLWASGARPIALDDTHTLVPLAGVRVDHARAAADDVPDLGDVRYAWTGFTAHTGLEHRVGESFTLHAGWDQGFRAPNLQETTLVGNTGNFFEVPNDSLRPERANTLEAGVRMRSDVGSADIRLWTMRITDVIEREPTTFDGQDEIGGTEVVRRINAGRAELLGAEGAIESAAWNGLSLRATTGWVRGRTEDSEDWQPIRREPPLRYSAALRWDFTPWSSRITLVGEGAAAQTRIHRGDEGDPRICAVPDYPGVLWRDLGQSCPGTDGWFTLGLRVRQDLGERTTLRLRLSNLLDRSYRHHGSGLDAPGFSAMIGIENRWGASR